MAKQKKTITSPKTADLAKPQATKDNDFGHNDPLLDCLVTLTHLFNKPYTADVLTAGLPLQANCLTPKLFVRAAQRAHLSAKIVKRPLAKISNLVLPAVLLLENGQCCILQHKHLDAQVDIIVPESGDGQKTISLEVLESSYTGFAIFVQPKFAYDARDNQPSEEKPRHWFWSVIAENKKLYKDVFFAAIMINCFAIASPFFVLNVYDRVVPNNAFATLWALSIGIIIVYIFDLIMRQLRAYFTNVAARKSDVHLSANTYEHIMGIKMGARPESVGALANNVNQFEGFRDFVTTVVITALIDLPFTLLFLIILAYVGGIVVIVPLLAIPVVLITAYQIQRKLHPITEKQHKLMAQKNALLVESLSGIESIKAVNAEGLMQSKWEQAVGEGAKLGVTSRGLALLANNITLFTQHMVTVLVVIIGVYSIANGDMSIGALIASVILARMAIAPLGQVTGLLTRYQSSKAALATLDQIMHLPIEQPKNKQLLQREDIKGGVAFKNVLFSYPEQATPALDSISLKIKPGEKIAIIGRIGSGKSTLGKLILNLYEPQQGSILIDGIDMGQINPVTLRKHIGYVPQDIALLHGSVKENITIGAPYVSDNVILKASELAGVTALTDQHPQGFDMPVGEAGRRISGGQRQTIGLARALLLDPAMLVLDEPTNAMDMRSEEAFKAMIRGFKDKTILIATHKSSLISVVDRIIVLEQGKVVADGPKDKVIAALKGGQVRSNGGES